jgi:hypothetical protein
VSFSFNADPFDVYMRWLNLKLFNMLVCGKYEEYFHKYAKKQYLGYLDSQIRWNCLPNQIPVGFDRRREFRYFSAAVAPMDQLIQDALYFIPTLILWPSCFAKHRTVASWQLSIRGYRFGGRQPRLGGIFLGAKNWRCVTTCAFIAFEWTHCVTVTAGGSPPPKHSHLHIHATTTSCNMAAFKEVCKLNLKSMCLVKAPGCMEKDFERVLESSIEWVVPPPPPQECVIPWLCPWKGADKITIAACRWTYILAPFPLNGQDEKSSDEYGIDDVIPIVIEKIDAYAFAMPWKSDPNALTMAQILLVVEKWEKEGGAQVSERRKEVFASFGSSVDELVKKCNDGETKETITADELNDILVMMDLLSRDARVRSPVFRRHRSSSVGGLITGDGKIVDTYAKRGSHISRLNPMAKMKSTGAKGLPRTAPAEPVAASLDDTVTPDDAGLEANWFYEDEHDASVQHGPHTLAELKQWMADGHFKHTDLVRHGSDGKDVELLSAAFWVQGPHALAAVKEWVADGHCEPKWVQQWSEEDQAIVWQNEDTLEHTNECPEGTTKLEMRVAPDRHRYTKDEFIAFYGDTVEWDESVSSSI